MGKILRGSKNCEFSLFAKLNYNILTGITVGKQKPENNTTGLHKVFPGTKHHTPCRTSVYIALHETAIMHLCIKIQSLTSEEWKDSAKTHGIAGFCFPIMMPTSLQTLRWESGYLRIYHNITYSILTILYIKPHLHLVYMFPTCVHPILVSK